VAAGGDVLIVGGGGHALVVIEVLRAAGYGISGALTREGVPTAGLERLGVSVVGTDTELAERVANGARRVFVAVGDNRTRQRLTAAVLAVGGELVAAISPDAVVSISTTVGHGALVMPGVITNALTTIGPGAIVNTRAAIDHECNIGAYAHVAPGVTMAGDVVVGEGALVGIGASVMPGRRIGAWAVVGAGAAITCDVPDGATVVGVPARRVDHT
jgi:UDP-perosamine 4-acetyltransferase